MKRWLRIVLAVELGAVFLAFVFESRNWMWMNDAQVPHYVVFLLRKGLSPYRQINDINLPGSYLSEWIGMSFPGGSDLGWRLYDYSLLALLIVAATVIAYRYDWLAGLYAGVLFAAMHGSEGPWFAADRDEVMTVLIFCGYALAYMGVRRRSSPWFCGAAVLLGVAFSIKQTAVGAEVFLFVPLLIQLRRTGARILPFLREIAIGTGMVLVANLSFLMWRGSVHAFFTRVPALTGYYAFMSRMPFTFMLQHSLPRGLAVLLPAILVLFFLNRSWREWEFQAVIGGAVLGLMSYFAQGKGFPYHRYAFVSFTLLWGGMEFVKAMRGGRFGRWLGYAGVLAGALAIGPFYLTRIARADMPDTVAKEIAKDLARFPPESLQHSVQCLDGVYGCYSALYRLQLQQSTGLMGDQLLFPHKVTQTIVNLRREFGDEILAAPPTVFIETNAWPWGGQTLTKIEAWPEFAAFLRKNYTVVLERTFPLAADDTEPVGYRIYYRNR